MSLYQDALQSQIQSLWTAPACARSRSVRSRFGVGPRPPRIRATEMRQQPLPLRHADDAPMQYLCPRETPSRKHLDHREPRHRLRVPRPCDKMTPQPEKAETAPPPLVTPGSPGSSGSTRHQVRQFPCRPFVRPPRSEACKSNECWADNEKPVSKANGLPSHSPKMPTSRKAAFQPRIMSQVGPGITRPYAALPMIPERLASPRSDRQEVLGQEPESAGTAKKPRRLLLVEAALCLPDALSAVRENQ